MNINFYKNLKPIDNITSLSNNAFYQVLPNDWLIVATDIKNSTKHIENGKYKNVNMLGALTIIAILNIDKNLELPYIFGGDGSFIFIPKTIRKDVEQALMHIQRKAFESYGFDLRAAIFESNVVEKYNKQILLSKQKVSDNLSQVIVKGGGLEVCDELLKNDDSFSISVPFNENFDFDISGLECRWEAIKTLKDENLTILIKANDESFYEELFFNLEKILGNVESRSAIKENNLNLTFSDELLENEALIYSNSSINRFFIRQKLKFINFLGKILMSKEVGEWKFYKKRIVSTTDSEKFDDMIRMVVSTTYTQTKNLEKYLNKEKELGKINFGIHKSDSSLMTCLIFERHGKHVHFIDGSDGGYALAAKSMKS